MAFALQRMRHAPFHGATAVRPRSHALRKALWSSLLVGPFSSAGSHPALPTRTSFAESTKDLTPSSQLPCSYVWTAVTGLNGPSPVVVLYNAPPQVSEEIGPSELPPPCSFPGLRGVPLAISSSKIFEVRFDLTYALGVIIIPASRLENFAC